MARQRLAGISLGLCFPASADCIGGGKRLHSADGRSHGASPARGDTEANICGADVFPGGKNGDFVLVGQDGLFSIRSEFCGVACISQSNTNIPACLETQLGVAATCPNRLK